jgi:predicted small secreted protein
VRETTIEEYKEMVKKALLITLLLCVILFAIGCQTMQGVGGDIRWLAGARDNPSGARHNSSDTRRNHSDTRDNYSDTRDDYSGPREDY